MLTVNQVLADIRRMERFIIQRIRKERTRIVLASGWRPDGPAWVDLTLFLCDDGDHELVIESNEPDAFGVREVYEQFRSQEMTAWEWERELAAEMNRWKVHEMERVMAVLREDQNNDAPSTLVATFSELAEKVVGLLEQRASSVVSTIPPEVLSKEDAARFLGVDVQAVEHLIRTRRLEYVQLGSQRGRVVPIGSLRKLIKDNLQLTGEELRRKRGRH